MTCRLPSIHWLSLTKPAWAGHFRSFNLPARYVCILDWVMIVIKLSSNKMKDKTNSGGDYYGKPVKSNSKKRKFFRD